MLLAIRAIATIAVLARRKTLNTQQTKPTKTGKRNTTSAKNHQTHPPVTTPSTHPVQSPSRSTENRQFNQLGYVRSVVTFRNSMGLMIRPRAERKLAYIQVDFFLCNGYPTRRFCFENPKMLFARKQNLHYTMAVSERGSGCPSRTSGRMSGNDPLLDGRPVHTGTAIYSLSIGLDGKYEVNVRADKRIERAVNQEWAFSG